MKHIHFMFLLTAAALILSACSNIPHAPTSTPTMSAEEVMRAAQETAEAMKRETETQWAIENPSPTPTDTATPTPEATPTSAIPLIPPTATEPPVPYFRIDNKSGLAYPVGKPENRSYDYWRGATIYLEICYQNGGTAIWNTGYFVMISNPDRAYINPSEVHLGKEVAKGEWACFSFQANNAEYSTGRYSHCPGFQLYADTGVAIKNGYNSVCWNIHNDNEDD